MKKNVIAWLAIEFLMVWISMGSSFAQNLIINGDFSDGNSGFTSDYYYVTCLNAENGQYSINKNPNDCLSGVSSYGDHTSGNGLMFNADGATISDKVVWQQTVSVYSNNEYIFSVWIASWIANAVNPAKLRFFINGVQIGEDYTAPANSGVWSQFSATWNSDNNLSATISIVDINLVKDGNNFSFDDLSFVPLCTYTDTDIDGVIDILDKCPNTIAGSWVDKDGCPASGLYTEDQMNQMVEAILTWGDTDGDKKITLIEAIQALRITSGVTEPAIK